MPKKRVKKNKIFFVVLSKYQSVTHVSTSILKYHFFICSFCHKQVISHFFTQTGLFTALNPTLCIKKTNFTKNPLNYYSLKVIKFYGDSVKNENAKTKNFRWGAKRPPPHSLFRIFIILFPFCICTSTCVLFNLLGPRTYFHRKQNFLKII